MIFVVYDDENKRSVDKKLRDSLSCKSARGSLIKRAPAYSCSDVGDQTNNRKQSQIWTRISPLRNAPLLDGPYEGDITDTDNSCHVFHPRGRTTMTCKCRYLVERLS